MYKNLTLLLSIATLLAGCATPNEADFSNADAACSQQCHANYSTCLSAFTLFPIQQNNQCVAGLSSCAKSCPTKGSAQATAQTNNTPTMDQAKSKCLELGFKAGTESFGQCVLKLSK
jgi:hypothetical protein